MTASSPSREASDSENTGIGDLRQERVRGRDGKRHTAGPGISGPGADPQRDADAAAGRNAQDRGTDIGRYGHHRRGPGAGELYRDTHRRVGGQGAGVGQGAALLRRIHAGGNGLWRHGLRGRRCGRYGRTAAAGVQRAVPDRKRPRYETMRGQGRGYGAGGGGIGRHAGAKADRGRRRGAVVRLFAEGGDRVPAGLSPAPAAERRGRGAGGGASCRAGADVFRPGIAAGVSAAEPGGARTAGQGAVPDGGVKRIPLKFHIHGG